MARRKKESLLEWGEPQVTKDGCTFWDTEDGRYKIIRADQCYGVKLPCRYTVWFKGYVPGIDKAMYKKIGEFRSKKKAFQYAETNRGSHLAASCCF